MDDTSPEIREKVFAMLREKTPEERLKMGGSMCQTSRYLVSLAILRDNPHISLVDFRKEIFLKYYRDDFSPEEQQKIFQHLAAHTPKTQPYFCKAP
jgi:hypothetical protein